MNEVTIEKAKVEDLEEIFQVQLQSSLETYPNEVFGITEAIVRDWRCGQNNKKLIARIEKYRKYIENNDVSRGIFIARQNDKIIGISFPYIEETGRHRLGAFYVLKEAWGKGVGSKLLKNALDWHGPNDIYLAVTTYNDRAIKFYEKHGFEKTGVSIEANLSEQYPDIKMPEFEMVRKY